jgi:ubiquinone/menaquinone biosynthesis C-methylase UbiE
MVQLHDSKYSLRVHSKNKLLTLANTAKGEEWAAVAKDYSKTASNLSSPIIGRMLTGANALHPFAEATAILDNGCGPGSIMMKIISAYGDKLPSSCTLSCSDFAESMVDAVRATKVAEVSRNASSPWQRVEANVMDSMDLHSIDDGSLSHVLAGWVFFMTSDPQKCLTESLRVLKAGGVLTASSWDGNMQWLQLMRLASVIRPDKQFPSLPEAWTNTSGVRSEFEKAGFREVDAVEVVTHWHFESYEAMANDVMTKTPQMLALLKDFSDREKEELAALVIQECKKMAPSEPYALKGVSIVAYGRK